MARRRLDAELVRRGLARSRQQACELIDSGAVRVQGAQATKAATQVEESAAIVVRAPAENYASRGAHKLIGALEAFPDVVVEGRDALDAGASTGGFTDVLLRRGVGRVIAVDVGYGQLAWSLSQDPRVTVMDRTNVRALTAEQLAFRPDLVVADLSFISLAVVLPALVGVSTTAADHLLMVKPQFEVGRERLGHGGVVTDPQARIDAVARIAMAAHGVGVGMAGVVASPLPGPSGNVEYFLWLRRDAPAPDSERIRRAVEEGPR